MTKDNYRTFHEYNIEKLRDPEDAQGYLEVALEEFEQDGDVEALMLALRDVAEARGGIGKIAKKAKMPRQSLYKMLSKRGNPTLASLNPILHQLGFKLSIVPLHSRR